MRPLQEEKKQVSDFVSDNGYTFLILLDSIGAVGADYGVSGIPTTYIIDRSGLIIAKLVGSIEWDKPETTAVLEEMLAL